MSGKNRIPWIDTLKALGMFFIVLGHFFPPYLSAWIYTFNVPLFFFVSGFLSKREEDWNTFWRKNVKGLVIPFLCLSLLINTPYIIGHATDARRMLYLFGGIILGFHSVDGMYGCLNMWFVYCLFLVKVLFQYSSRSRGQMFALTVACMVGMTVYHVLGLHVKWALSNVLYALPFFMLGYGCRQKAWFTAHTACEGSRPWDIAVAMLAVCSAFAATHNGIAYTYEGVVGISLAIFTLCSLVNLLLMIRLACLLQHYMQRSVRLIARGSILILAFHLVALYPAGNLIRRLTASNQLLEVMAFIFASLLICVLFIPVIQFVKKHVPLLMGGR